MFSKIIQLPSSIFILYTLLNVDTIFYSKNESWWSQYQHHFIVATTILRPKDYKVLFIVFYGFQKPYETLLNRKRVIYIVLHSFTQWPNKRDDKIYKIGIQTLQKIIQFMMVLIVACYSAFMVVYGCHLDYKIGGL